MTAQIEARYGASGAFLLNAKIPGVTQTLSDEAANYYGGRHFICEAIFQSAAKAIADAMGWKWIGIKQFSGDKT
jgi:hypothetical protein